MAKDVERLRQQATLMEDFGFDQLLSVSWRAVASNDATACSNS